MPPTRRKSSAPHAQQTLAFGPRSNKVTKPSLPPSSKNLDPPSPPLPTKPLPTDQTPSPSPTTPSAPREETTEIPNPDQGLAFRLQGHPQPDDIDEKARKVSEKQIKTYWHAKEEERKAPRGPFSPSPPAPLSSPDRSTVHQQGLSLHEKILRHFDLSSQYGPCIGVARMKRWKRAHRLGLAPPVEVLAVLVREGAEGRRGSERAYVDQLMCTRLVVE